MGSALPFFPTKSIHQSEEANQIIGAPRLYGSRDFSGELLI